MKAVIDELPALVRMQHRLVSLVGAIAHDGSSNRYDVALRTAEKTSSKFFLLPSPFLADSPEERRQWCRHRLYRAVETLAGQADVAFVGIGQMGIGCPMHREGFINEAVVNELVEVGAVGETLGWAFGRLSAVDSKPASGGRIKTSHFFSFKPVVDVLARGDLRISRQIQR
jgi:DNA-binding transcriptional regulator LsrR (DeoR family)